MKTLIKAIGLLLLIMAGPVMADPAPLILISIDGFRADYLNRGVSPNLAALAAGGVRADRMTPSFPSVTFPNHTALVTGLYPDHNGIVNNAFDDPALPGHFTMGSHDEGWWGQSTPIWISAERAGIPTGVEFWPGVGVAHQGTRPGLWHDFDHAVTPAARVDTVLGWMDLPPGKRPGFAVLYFETVDSAGHSFGPDSPQVDTAIAAVDAAVGQLVAGLKARGIAANLIVVADHGMAPVGSDHLILLDDLIDTGAVHVAFDGTVLGIDTPGTPAGNAVRQKLLAPQPHMQCWDKTKIPAELHYGTNPRVPAVVCQVETGWLALTREGYKKGQELHPGVEKGAHGYDIHDPRMGALFIASGPAFRAGLTIAPFPNVDVYPLMAKVLGITPLANDGKLADLAPILR
jgi:predicted AlkP superfamily pyrophosphatase or phosphodiesterase